MKKLHAWLLGCAVAGFVGCYTDPAVVGTTEAAQSQSPCGECADGKLCNPDSGKCVACLTHADCGDAGGQKCDPHSFECVQCLVRADCDDGLVCGGGACIACSDDAECGEDSQCEDGQCENADHSDDSSESSGSDGSGGNSGED